MFSAGKAANELLKESMKDFLKIIEAAQKRLAAEVGLAPCATSHCCWPQVARVAKV